MNKYYIVRCAGAGVFAGNIKAKEGNEVTMTNARRLWRWEGASDTLQLAAEGVKNPRSCKFTMTVAEIQLLNVIEIIPCTVAAEASIRGVSVWKI